MAQSKEEFADDKELQPYCICKKPYNGQEFMIECNACGDWFHGSCVGIQEHEAFDIETYHCPMCTDKVGPLVLKRRRNFHRHDYSEINSGSKAIQSGTLAFIWELKKKKILDSEGIVKRLKGDELTVDYLNEHGLVQPILVEDKDGLGIVVPDDTFSILDVEKHVGSMRDLDVIDVSQQDDFKMKMRHWTEYYETRPRRKVLNVISLEFSDTALSSLVHPPDMVHAIDWINVHWPEELDKSGDKRPQVQKYCLMSVENSYTDFHVDFGGTSVWYHVLKGKKIFYLIPPTTENLLKYEQWVSSSSQSEVFFGDLVDHCYKCSILAGNTFFIPSGWIHAVFTPADSLVFGGNFLNEFCIKQQLNIYDLEARLKTPERFLHPKYEKLVWFAAKGLQEKFEECTSQNIRPHDFLLNGIHSLYTALSSWSRDKKHCKEIPQSVNEVTLLSALEGSITYAQGKYGMDYHSDPPLGQWQRPCFVSGEPLKLKLKRDSTIKSSVEPSKRRSPKQSRKRHTESVQDEEDGQEDGDFVYLDLYDELQTQEEGDDHNWVPSGSIAYSRKKGAVASSKSIGKRNAMKPMVGKAIESTAAKLSKIENSTTSPGQQSKQLPVHHKSKAIQRSKPTSSKQRLGKILGIKGAVYTYQSLKK